MSLITFYGVNRSCRLSEFRCRQYLLRFMRAPGHLGRYVERDFDILEFGKQKSQTYYVFESK
jgi:hypothetical protein